MRRKHSTQFFKKELNVRTVGLLPVMVDRRLAVTGIVLDSLKQLSTDEGVPHCPAIRTDSAVAKPAPCEEVSESYSFLPPPRRPVFATQFRSGCGIRIPSLVKAWSKVTKMASLAAA
jgi:hypothetical protein